MVDPVTAQDMEASPREGAPIGISLSLGYCTFSYLGLGMWFRHPDEEARWFPEGVSIDG